MGKDYFVRIVEHYVVGLRLNKFLYTYKKKPFVIREKEESQDNSESKNSRFSSHILSKRLFVFLSLHKKTKLSAPICGE